MFFQNCFTLLHNSFLFHSIFTHRFFFAMLKSYTSVTIIQGETNTNRTFLQQCKIFSLLETYKIGTWNNTVAVEFCRKPHSVQHHLIRVCNLFNSCPTGWGELVASKILATCLKLRNILTGQLFKFRISKLDNKQYKQHLLCTLITCIYK